jgi:hypothetical protein
MRNSLVEISFQERGSMLLTDGIHGAIFTNCSLVLPVDRA